MVFVIQFGMLKNVWMWSNGLSDVVDIDFDVDVVVIVVVDVDFDVVGS